MKIGLLLDKKNDWLLLYLSKKDFKQISNIKITIGHDISRMNNHDVIFILGYTKKITRKDLLRNKLNLVIHESNLPQDRGFSPIQHQILNGKNNLKVSLIIANAELDKGSILLKHDLKFDGTELYDEIREKQAKITKSIIYEFIKNYPEILDNKIKQMGAGTFNKKLTLKDNELNIHQSIDKQFNKLRIGNNEEWPSYFYKKGIKYIIKIYKDK